jgi:hypothetical protein
MSSERSFQLGIANSGGTGHANAEDMVLYALQFLPDDQAADLASHVEHCDRCRNELALTQGDLAACAFTSDLQLPSALARQRLRTQVTRENHPVLHTPPALAAFGRNGSILTPHEDALPKRNLALTLLGWLGWIAAAGLAAVTAILYQGEIAQRARLSVQSNELTRLTADAAHATPVLDALNDSNAMRMVLTAKPPAKPQPLGRVTYNPSNGSLIFLVDDLDPLETGKVYELWLLPTDGRSPIAAALFHPDNQGNASVILPTLPTGVAAKGFAVSIEDDGGTQTPTPPFVLASS